MSTSGSPLSFGLYFIDVLACLLFCIPLALVGARFGRERIVELELPELPRDAHAGSDLSGPTISVRNVGDRVEVYLDGEAVTLDVLEVRLRAAPPSSVVLRSEASPLSGVIAIAHAAGVRDIRLAYEAGTGGKEAP